MTDTRSESDQVSQPTTENYITKQVRDFFSNNEGEYLYVKEIRDHLKDMMDDAKQVKSGIWTTDDFVKFKLSDAIKDHIEDYTATSSLNQVQMSMINFAISSTDWDAIALEMMGWE